MSEIGRVYFKHICMLQRFYTSSITEISVSKVHNTVLNLYRVEHVLHM